MIKYFLEFKNRLFFIILFYFSTFLVLYFYKEILLFLLVQPKNKVNINSSFFYFIFTDVTEIFYVYIKLILFINLQIFVLFTSYHIFLFLIPALFKKEYFYVKTFIKTSFYTWVFSGLVSNYFIIPLSWNFFLSFQNFMAESSFNLYFEAKLNEYFYFYISFYYICFFYFQFSILLFWGLKHINEEVKNIKKFRKVYYFCFVILSTLLCPDFITQLLLSFLLITLYEILIIVFLFNFYNKFN